MIAWGMTPSGQVNFIGDNIIWWVGGQVLEVRQLEFKYMPPIWP